MRKVISVIAMLIGAAALVVGIGQKTFWAPPETVTATMPELSGTAPLTLIESSVNSTDLAPVELVISSQGKFTASLGRSYDVDAWVGDTSHVSVTGIDTQNHQMQAQFVDGGKDAPNPQNADIFFDSQEADGTMTYRWTAPDSGDWSLLLATGGKDAAPVDISVTYANNAAMPMALPLIIVGALLLVFGLALLVMRTGKPSNKSDAAKSTAQHSVAAAAVVALAVSGVAMPMAPKDDASASPSESASQPAGESAASESPAADSSAPAEESAAYPVVTEEQLTRILNDVQKQLEKADDSQKAKDLDDRAAGAFRYIRSKHYTLLKEKASEAKPLAINTQVLRSAAVPNANNAEFPRVITVVTAKDNDADTLPQSLTLVQKSARDNYKVVFAQQMLGGSTFPGIAVGDPSVKQLSASAEGLKETPEQALKDVAEVLDNEKSKNRKKFSDDASYFDAIHQDQKNQKKEAKEAEISFKRSVEKGDTYVLSTPDGGAIVTGKLNQSIITKRGEDADVIELNDKITQHFVGKKESSKDLETIVSEPVMLYIPAEGSNEKIGFIGAGYQITDAKEKK